MRTAKRVITLLLTVCLAAGIRSAALAETAPMFGWTTDKFAAVLPGEGDHVVQWGRWVLDMEFESRLYLTLDLDEPRQNVAEFYCDTESMDEEDRTAFMAWLAPLLRERTGAEFEALDLLAAGESVEFSEEKDGWIAEGDDTFLDVSSDKWDASILPLDELLSALEEAGETMRSRSVTRTISITRRGEEQKTPRLRLVLDENGRVTQATLQAVDMEDDAGIAFMKDGSSAMLTAAGGEAAARFIEENYRTVEPKKPARTEADGFKLEMRTTTKGLRRLTIRCGFVPADAAVLLPGGAAAPAPAATAAAPKAPVQPGESGAEIFAEGGITAFLTGSPRYDAGRKAWAFPLEFRNGGTSAVTLCNAEIFGFVNENLFEMQYSAEVPAGGSAPYELLLADRELAANGIAAPNGIRFIRLPVYRDDGTGEAFLGMATISHDTLFAWGPVAGPAGSEEPEDGAVVFSAEGLTFIAAGGVETDERTGRSVIPFFVRNDGDADVILSNPFGNGKVNGFEFYLDYDALVPAKGSARVELALPAKEELAAYCIDGPDRIESVEFPVRVWEEGGSRKLGKATVTHMDLFGTEAPEAAAPAFGQMLPETVLGEFGGATLRLLGISPDGKALVLRVDNTADERRCAILQDVCVNGWQLNGSFAVDADAHDYVLQYARLGDRVPGYTGFCDVSFTFKFYRRVTPSEPFYEEIEKKDRAVELRAEPGAEVTYPAETGTVLFETSGCRLVYRGHRLDARRGVLELDLLFVNENGKEASVVDVYTKKKLQFEINGKKVTFGSGLINVTVMAGMRREATISLLPYELEKAGLRAEDVRTLDFSGALYIGGKKAVKSIPMHIDVE